MHLEKIYPNVAILLAAFEGEDYIKEQIDTIMSLKGVTASLFVSLDQSRDNSSKILEEISLKYAITILDNGKRFGSAGQNFFHLLNKVDFSSFDYVAFADQDDIWYSSKLIDAIDCMEKSHASGYSSNVTAFWESGHQKLVKKDYPQAEFDYLFESPGPGCTFVMTNELASDIKGQLITKQSKVKTLWLHDWYCYSFARSRDYKWIIDSKPSMLYRQHSSNEVGANSGLKSFITRCSVMLKGDGFNKVIEQANFIGQVNLKPIKLLCSNSRFNFIKLFFMSFKCRRQFSHKLFFALVCLFFVVWGYKYESEK